MDDTFELQIEEPSETIHQKGKGHRKRVDKNVVLDEGRELIPRPLNPDLYNVGKEHPPPTTVYDAGQERMDATVSGSISVNIFKSQSTARFRTDADKQTEQSLTYKGSVSFGSNVMETLVIDVSSDRSSESLSSSFGSNSEDAAAEDAMREVPTHISLILSETNTDIILDLPSSTVIKDSEDGTRVEQQNQHYEYLTVGKGRNRKVVTAEVQTVPILKKSRNTEAARVKTCNSYAYVSNYEMFDTYLELAEAAEQSDDSKESEMEDNKPGESPFKDTSDGDEEEEQMKKLMKNQKFLEAVCVIERLLANNCYNEEQKWFRGLSIPSDFRENIEYNYKLRLLWTFANEHTKGKCVNSFHWNPLNKDILAVGYGKFYFTDTTEGLVMLWNIKNPVQPERTYHFVQAVTTLQFSQENPNLLAVGFMNGHIVVLNVVSREKLIVGENTPPFEPVWSVTWQPGHNEYKGKEVVYGMFSDGRIILYVVDRKLKGQQLMRIPRVEGKLKGFEMMAFCTSITMPVSRYSSAVNFMAHPVNSDIYYIGSNHGVVHKCSKNYLNQHLECFHAHFGTIRGIKFSPFSSKLFATCGDDWTTRLWAQDIAEPIIESCKTQQSVMGFDWSPAISTVLAAIRGNTIMVWDLQRKTYAPQSVLVAPSQAKCTYVEFTDSGRCLVVGDIEGYVHIFALEDMPFKPFFQENALFEALYRSLVTSPELTRKLRKIRKDGFYEEKA